jgi:hypothetical protein
MTTPARELKTATMSEQINVSFKAATASGWVTAFQNDPHPLSNALLTTAARGRRTRRLR